MTRANVGLMQDVVEMAFENRMFYAHAEELAENPVLKQQYRRMTNAKDELIDKLTLLVAGRAAMPVRRRTIADTLRSLYTEALVGLGTYGAPSSTYTAPITESERRLLDHFDQVVDVAGSVDIRATLIEQLPKLRACQEEMQLLGDVRSEARP